MAAVFAAKFAETVVPNKAATQALQKYGNYPDRENGKYLYKSNKNYKIKYTSSEYKHKSTITRSVRQW